MDGRILGRVKYGMGDLAYRDLLKLFVRTAARKQSKDQHGRKQKRQKSAPSFFHDVAPF
jgi:hypothetical protein